MLSYMSVWWIKIYMTWIGIVLWFITFLIASHYLIRKYHQDFRKFFYRLPIFIILIYFFWVYVDFLLNVWIFPKSRNELLFLISPYWYKFHFAWVLLWSLIAFRIFFKRIKRNENKKIRIDIFFYSISLSLIPIWIFFLLWDNFIWKTCEWLLCIKPLNTESELNKFNWVYPAWLFLSIWSFIALLITVIIKKNQKKFWFGILWLSLLIIITNIVIMLFQNYPRHWTIQVWWIIFDIKQYISFFIIMLMVYSLQKRKKE